MLHKFSAARLPITDISTFFFIIPNTATIVIFGIIVQIF